MALSLKDLATEIQLAISDVLVRSSGGHVALCEWSCTCSFYRSLLAPYVLKTVSLHNDEDCASAVLRIARGPHSEHVKNLVYTGLSSDFVSDGYEFHHSQTTHNVFPPLVGDVLSGLQQFPCLSSLDIRFPLHQDKWLNWIIDEGWEMELSSTAEVVAAETRDVGRSLMNQTYKSLAQNANHRITALALRDLQSLEVSTFSSENFHRFLQSIQKFELSTFGFESDYYMNVHAYHLQFVSRLGAFFFDHLHSVQEFVLKTNEYAPLGVMGWGHASFGLSAHQMPLLKHVHLEWIFICAELVEFLISKSTTLESVSLHQCKGSPRSTTLMDENCLPWQALFRAISISKPSRLRQFIVTPVTVAPEVYKNQPEITPEVLELLQNDSERRMFHYSYLDEKYGYVFDDLEAIINSFLDGKDERAYDELMAIVNANASSLSKA
jgi:hypothetical protein